MLRRGVLSGRLEEARARMVIADLTHWPADRISHRLNRVSATRVLGVSRRAPFSSRFGYP